MSIVITPIEPRWFGQKAQVHAQTWRETYEGKLPQELIDLVSPEFALDLTKRFAADPNEVMLVALERDDGSDSIETRLGPNVPKANDLSGARVIGFAEVLRVPRAPIDRHEAAELASLYVLKSEHRHGVGRALVEAAASAIGNRRLALWVFDGNENAQGFYQHIGFHPTGLKQTEDDGSNPELEMINY